MKIISLANQKGGCGKTTTAINLASALAKKGNKTLLIDLDPQAHATFALGITPQKSVVDVIENYINTNECELLSTIIERQENLSVLPSSIGLSTMEPLLSNREDKLNILSQMLNYYQAYFEYCIIDCPPNLGVLTLNAIIASNYTIVPLDVSDLSLRGIDHFHTIISMVMRYSGKVPTLFYLITQFDRRLKYSFKFLERAKEKFGSSLLRNNIRTNVSLRQAIGLGQTIYEFKPDSRGAEDYMNLAKEIEQRTSEGIMVPFFFKGNGFKEVYLVGEFNNWQKQDNYRLSKLSDDTWMVQVPLKQGKYSYKFLADGDWIADPHAPILEDDPYGGKNSVIKIV